ncbi:sugar ABC transporter ATP-binding protein [Ectobacillus sp. SYSU M60031]|uniref:Autoinducer 2 import ATP-binding protein LsrA n=2 Tax=Ectobacillus ponti TaxID=2961894 RepID=A0AA42BNW4_9BACI|nr:sugar ABC transporter ATP-binding protein [Ectobacillus ponti]MCP8968142.1 sugar ABC transporter ATP-binding protein [Ectobacillus ponti]
MAFQLHDISHSYGAVPVLKKVSLTVEQGEVHALLGMNGAGKSTLMKVAAGDFPPVAGALSIDGKNVSFRSPRDAKEAGIAFVAQEVDHALIPTLSVLENVLMDQLASKKAVRFSKRRLEEEARRLLSLVDADLDVHQPVANCSLHEKQLILIARALSNHASFILFDEPTAALGPKEAEHFGRLVQILKQQRVGILFISHRLAEIRKLADAVTVLRDGHVVLSAPVAATEDRDIVTAMTGKTAAKSQRTVRNIETPYKLQVEDLIVSRGKAPLSFGIRKGETLVIYGLVGSGKSSLAETLFGARNAYRATIEGKTLTIRKPQEAIEAGIAFVPEERRKQGLFLSESIGTHLNLHQRGWLRPSREKAHAQTAIQSFDIRPGQAEVLVQRLSGGNQQKVSIAKWAGFSPDIFILDEPTKGVDVAAKEDVFRFIEEITNAGSSVLYVTGEQDEALRIADRILVLTKNGFAAELRPDEASEEQLLQLAEGGIPLGTDR